MSTASVELTAVSEEVLSELVAVASRDAHPDEVTPPLTPGEDWTAERLEWLRSFHRERRAGLAGPAGEATWAVRVDGSVVGAARLQATGRAGSVEVGLWLARSHRRRGIGRRVLAALLEQAAAAGAGEVCAQTTRANTAAIGVLGQLGFELTEVAPVEPAPSRRAAGPAVRATLRLSDQRRISPPTGGRERGRP